MLWLINKQLKTVFLVLSLFLLLSGNALAFKPFIIDTDVGMDDVIAMLYLLQRKDIQIKAITIESNGNAHCKPALRNTLGLLKIVKQTSIPVACGRLKPLVGQHQFPSLVLDEADTLGSAAQLLPQVTPGKPQKAVDLMIKTLLQSKQPVTILAIGPLTTIAEAFQKAPQIKSHIKTVYVAGGALNVPGNIPEVDHSIKNYVAEWNLYIDPSAADIVFNNLPVTLVPLDVTDQFPIDMDFYALLKNKHTSPPADYIFKLLEKNIKMLEMKDWWYFWDPLAAVVASDESIATFKVKRLRILLTPEEQSGETVVDNEVKQKIRVVMSVNEVRFKQLLLTYLNKPID